MSEGDGFATDCVAHHSLLSLCRTIALGLVLFLQVAVFAIQFDRTPA